ncbi:3-ketoacyl-CoA thiolase [Patulibacter medicamentivorans]|uniref:3-ketoacyl-CoA thiolase n=1 Tax=Patulibacter medicamentivorans TaxID=1097667 RepID=H0E6Y8_9ACTN|nr:acetyl-CoA C-acyltransferase [Patulibacter medicamentivorans]EHN10553.1 3-ketoacyl-CoA thiolase [Patulibacter medicamentivorans]
MPEVVIVDAVRTPIGRAVKGSLKDVRADDLAAIPLKALQERNPGVDWSETVDVLMGAASGEGEQGFNIARNASLLAGLPFEVPGVTSNRFCASSLHTIRTAFHAIKAGEGDQYIAAGVEAVSRSVQGGAWEFHPLLNGSEGSICNVYLPMGLTAENVAKQWNVSRESQDEWAAKSQQRAVAARDSGHFDKEITPVTLADGTVVTQDDGPRPGTTVEKLAQLKPVFDPENGTVTAGNACPLNDGAAATLIMSAEKAEKLGLKPRARIIATTVAGVRPEIMGVGPIPAIQKLLAQTGKKIEEIDIVEINEAFAAQIVPCKAELGISDEQLNPFGGAIALGHPFGMTGARIMTTLINGLETTGGRYGIESMCVAGGMGMAALIERI